MKSKTFKLRKDLDEGCREISEDQGQMIEMMPLTSILSRFVIEQSWNQPQEITAGIILYEAA